MRQKLADFMTIVRGDPAVENVVGFTGGAQRNSGFMFVALKPLTERTETADQVIARLRGEAVQGTRRHLFLQPVQDIRIGGRPSNAQYQFTLQADDLGELRTWEPKIRAALGSSASTGRRQYRHRRTRACRPHWSSTATARPGWGSAPA